MERVDSNITYNEEIEIIYISGINDTEISIDYSVDVDFTHLVTELTKCIDDGKEINLSVPTFEEDAKVKMVINTIEDIIAKYNLAISEEIDTSTDNGNTLIDLPDDEDLDEDLPF